MGLFEPNLSLTAGFLQDGWREEAGFVGRGLRARIDLERFVSSEESVMFRNRRLSVQSLESRRLFAADALQAHPSEPASTDEPAAIVSQPSDQTSQHHRRGGFERHGFINTDDAAQSSGTHQYATGGIFEVTVTVSD